MTCKFYSTASSTVYWAVSSIDYSLAYPTWTVYIFCSDAFYSYTSAVYSTFTATFYSVAYTLTF